MDLALNNLQRLICHKTNQTKPNQTKPNTDITQALLDATCPGNAMLKTIKIKILVESIH